MDIQGSVMEMKLYHGKKIMEWRRWFISPVFVVIVILCGTVTLLDVCSSENFVADLNLYEIFRKTTFFRM